ncbi:hypothetical protein N9N34_03575, partial [Candidatus Pelagibacter bacterium]|nr:hypothetical protein [Candidatus Pelagibacter bacterium]
GKTFSNFINFFLKSKYKFGISYKFYLFKSLNIYWSKPNLFYNFLVFDKFLFFTSKKFLKKIEHLPTILYRIVKDLKLNIKVSDPYHYEVNKKQNLKFTKLFKNKIKNKYILIHLDEKWSDIIDINENFYYNLTLFQKRIKKQIVITSFKNNLQYYKNVRNKIIKNKHFLLFENLSLGMFERFISKSLISISCHSGFLVQVSGTNRSNIIDVINKIDYNWYSSWKPYNTQHKFVFKSNLYKKFKTRDILDNIITVSKKFK